MNVISRNPYEAAKKTYDVIIIGGGIYGVMLSLITSSRGLKSLLLEKKDFGGATSYNSLRILHGGLRYLQTLDLPRFFESVAERKWFMKTFPELVHPLPCLMPLYNRGLLRSPILRTALKLNDLFSFNRNWGIPSNSIIPNGKIISPKEVENIFQGVNKNNLKAGALWYDGSIPDSQRVVIELIKLACSNGASTINYCEVINIQKDSNGVIGVEAVEQETGNSLKFKSKIIINSAGPWSRQLGNKFDKDYEHLFRPSIAWNILFNRKAISDHALAITPDKPNASTYFLRPWKGMLLAGTVHEPWFGNIENPQPLKSSVKNFIDDLNHSVPELNLSEEEILHIYSGLLPVKENGTKRLTKRGVIIDHSESGGPKGLFSIAGIKFTTSRLFAEKTINMIFPRTKGSDVTPININKKECGLFDFDWYPDEYDSSWKEILKKIIERESVVHLDDLILRRTSIGDNPSRALDIAPIICNLFNWDTQRSEIEIKRLRNFYQHKQMIFENSVLQ